ncbi:MAG: PEP-CTERM sorting domain-containing protein [Phycisphaerales bacterium]|nr:PEP-CTERM sorting domain-containing protein [Phycisphaerales bacterium]
MKVKSTIRQIVILNCLAMAVLNATVSAAIILDNPAQISSEPMGNPSEWDSATNVFIANAAGSNAAITLDNTNGITTITVLDTNIGAPGTGALTVAGNGAQWTSDGAVNVGILGGMGTLNAGDNGSITTTELHLGYLSSTASGVVNLTTGGRLNVLGTDGSNLQIGASGAGTINVLSGSTFHTAGSAYLAYGATTGTVNVEGPTSAWISEGNIYIAGRNANSNSQLNISDGGEVYSDTNPITVYVGTVGTGSLGITTGGKLTTGGGFIGSASTANGTAIIDGSNSTWTNNGDIIIAQNGGTGSITVRNVGLLETNRIVAGSGNASLEFSGGTLHALISTTDFISGNYASLTLSSDLLRAYAPAMALQVDNGKTVTVSQVFTGTGGMAKTGTGILTLNGNQQYTGLTDVRYGTMMGQMSFAGDLTIRTTATFSPGIDGAWTVDIEGNYTQESSSTLIMDVGNDGTDELIVGGSVNLNGTLALNTNGIVDADYYVLIDNLGGSPVNGFFSTITLNGITVTLDPINGTGGGGSFDIEGKTYMLTYMGQSSNGFVFGGNDVLLTTIIPEPASLAILGLGVVGLLTRRRK